jgi:hypothetical protein
MWQFVALDDDGVPLGEIDAHDRRVTWRVMDACDAEFAISADSLQGFIAEGINDVAVYRDHSLLFRGRMVSSSCDNLSADAANITVGIVDYRSLLGHRTIWPGTTAIVSGYSTVVQAAIAWDLINDSQAPVGGSWGITQGTGSTTGINRTRAVGFYTTGQNLREAVDDLGRLSNGFDWEIDPLLRFNVYYPRRGSLRDFVITRGNTSSLTRSVDLSTYANIVRVSGDTGVTPWYWGAGDLATRPEGRWELQEGNTDLKSVAATTARSERLFNDSSTIQPAYTATLSALSGWDPTKLWVGDTCPIRVARGSLDIDTTGRVVELTADIGDNNDETVSMTFDKPPMSSRLVRDLRSMATRLDRLDRR